jgi:hypothetical protein
MSPEEILDTLDRRVKRMELALDALLDDVALNPSTAVESARFFLDPPDPPQSQA